MSERRTGLLRSGSTAILECALLRDRFQAKWLAEGYIAAEEAEGLG